jgi:hypothetical protein
LVSLILAIAAATPQFFLQVTTITIGTNKTIMFDTTSSGGGGVVVAALVACMPQQ